MFESVKLLLCKLLRIPPEPSDPMGDVRSVRVFRASVRYYYYKLLGWLLGSVAGILIAIALCTFLAITLTGTLKGSPAVITSGAIETAIAAVLVVGGAIFKAGLGLFLVRLDYEMRWYKLSDRSLRIREGIFTVKEMTMTFLNIQNIEISQGPIQRLFGIYDLKVESAGGGAVIQATRSNMQDASAPHIAYFRGVDNPKEIMELMRERLKGVHDAGLGHPEDERLIQAQPSAPASPEGRDEILLKVLTEAKALRSALELAAANH